LFACARPITRCLLPPLPSILLDEEVTNNKEGIDDDTNAAADDITATEDIAAAADDDNDDDATMPPKVKPLTKKTTKKDMAAASVKPPPPPPAAAAATSFSVDAEDPITVSDVAEDGLSVLFVRAISSMSFDKKILRKIMGAEYRESSSRVVAWDDTALDMQAKNVRPVNGLFWGEP
jgi:hypothetical protein